MTGGKYSGNTVPLREYMDTSLSALRHEMDDRARDAERLNETRHQEIERAAALALRAAEIHLETSFNALRDLEELQHREQEKALKLALETMGIRLDHLNEFRESVRLITSASATRDEIRQLEERINERVNRNKEEITDLKTFRAVLDSKASQMSVIVAWVMSAVGLILGIVSLILKLVGG
jgi:hypothetical protein